jgi:hypothetical protein
MNTLFEITNELARLNDLLESGAIDEQAFSDTLEASIRQDAENKLEACAWAIRKLRAEAENLKDAAKELTAKSKSRGLNADRIEASVLRFMTAMDVKKVKAGHLDFAIQKNPVSVQIEEGTQLPENFLTIKTITDPNKAAIKEALEAGGTVPGCSLVTKERLVLK